MAEKQQLIFLSKLLLLLGTTPNTFRNQKCVRRPRLLSLLFLIANIYVGTKFYELLNISFPFKILPFIGTIVLASRYIISGAGVF